MALSLSSPTPTSCEQIKGSIRGCSATCACLQLAPVCNLHMSATCACLQTVPICTCVLGTVWQAVPSDACFQEAQTACRTVAYSLTEAAGDACKVSLLKDKPVHTRHGGTQWQMWWSAWQLGYGSWCHKQNSKASCYWPPSPYSAQWVSFLCRTAPIHSSCFWLRHQCPGSRNLWCHRPSFPTCISIESTKQWVLVDVIHIEHVMQISLWCLNWMNEWMNDLQGRCKTRRTANNVLLQKVATLRCVPCNCRARSVHHTQHRVPFASATLSNGEIWCDMLVVTVMQQGVEQGESIHVKSCKRSLIDWLSDWVTDWQTDSWVGGWQFRGCATKLELCLTQACEALFSMQQQIVEAFLTGHGHCNKRSQVQSSSNTRFDHTINLCRTKYVCVIM